MTQFTEAQTALTEELRRIVNMDEIAKALGIQDISSKDEEFWTGQRRAATSRLYMFCLHRRNWDLAIRREELSDEQAYILRFQVSQLMNEGLTYSYVRQWFLNYGQYAFNTAIARRKEREHIESHAHHLLVVHAEKGVSYLAYNDEGIPILVNSPAMAHQFPVQSMSELSGTYLAERTKDFVAIQAMFGAKSVKLLVVARRK